MVKTTLLSLIVALALVGAVAFIAVMAPARKSTRVNREFTDDDHRANSITAIRMKPTAYVAAHHFLVDHGWVRQFFLFFKVVLHGMILCAGAD